MGTEIELGKWKVKRLNELNWQVYELREIKDGPMSKRGGETDWVKCDAYFGKLENAIEWVYDRETGEMGRKTLKGAIAQMRRIRTQLANEIREALA